MTVKDLAELCMQFGLMCHKCVSLSAAVLAMIDRMYLPNPACRLLAKQSPHSSVPTYNAVMRNKTSPYSFAMSCPARLLTMTLSPHSTPESAAPIALTQKARIGSRTFVAELWSGI